MSPTIIGIIGIVVLIVVLFSRMPVALVMVLVGFLGFSYLVSFEAGLSIIFKDIFGIFTAYTFTVLPLFIFMGEIAFKSGISRRLFYTAYRWLGHMPGGLAMATVGACAGFAAVCGSSMATAATMGTVVLPEMKRYNYDPALATGTIAAGGTIGILIPPSVILIVYGILTEQSIGKLFLAGVLPGLLSVAYYLVTIYILMRRNPALGPPGPVVSFKEKLASLSGTLEMLVLVALVMGGLFIGFFTPTEAGAVGALGALIIATIRRQLTWQGFRDALTETTWMTAMAFLILVGATIFGHFLTVTRIPFDLAGWAGGLALPPLGILVAILFIYIIGGCFISAMALIILTVPIFFPVVIALGFDPIWFGVMIVMMCEMGAITPPVGMNVYIISGVAKDVPLEVIFKGVLPFLAADVARVATLIALPQIALFIPSLMG